MLNIEKIKEIEAIYGDRVKHENNDTVMNIYITALDALFSHSLVGTKTDKRTFGEYTRRFKRAVGELEKLIKDEGLSM